MKPLKLSDLVKGDMFLTTGKNANIAACTGTIESIGRINIKFGGMYMGHIEMHDIKLPKSELIGAMIVRNNELYAVEDVE